MLSRLAALPLASALVAAPALLHGAPAHAKPPLMPQEMLDACDGLQEGAACTFKLQGKPISGTCAPLPDTELACRPGSASKKPPAKPPAPAPKS